MIKAVIFDVDGVLMDSFDANVQFFDDLLRKFGHIPPTREEYVGLMGSNMKDIIRQFSKLESEEEVKKIWRAGKDREVPYPSHLAKTPTNLQETIEILNKDFTLGIVTSRVKSGVFEVPQLVPLEFFFKAVVSYEDTENHKPHPDPLILAAQRLKVLPKEAVYIGDTETDVIAAKNAGMKVILYSKEISNDADACTSIFSELPNLIKKL